MVNRQRPSGLGSSCGRWEARRFGRRSDSRIGVYRNMPLASFVAAQTHAVDPTARFRSSCGFVVDPRWRTSPIHVHRSAQRALGVHEPFWDLHQLSNGSFFVTTIARAEVSAGVVASCLGATWPTGGSTGRQDDIESRSPSRVPRVLDHPLRQDYRPKRAPAHFARSTRSSS